MKRATALKVLAATLVLLTVASAVPVALILQADDAASPGASSPAGSSSRTQGAATLGLPFGPAGVPAAETPPASAGGPGGSSSRPGLPGTATGSGSAVLDQVIGAAQLMGIDAKVPDLPLDQLDPVNPLRAAILGWVAATNAQVPPDELARELARADALPPALQRDVALLLLSATQATLLQREATAALTPEQLAWIYAHPEAAAALAQGEVTPDTQHLAMLAGVVDAKKSIQASLLLLTAVEATRGSLAAPETQDALAALDGAPSLDPATQALLRVLATASTRTTDQDKVRFAAELVAATTGATVPAPVEATSFADAVARLAAATAQTPDATQLGDVLARADALPDDLERALAGVIVAEALAVDAAAAPDVTKQGEALARVLVTVADALPTLEKHSLYWRHAPDALRVGQWDAQTRIGWAVEHAAYFVSTRGDAADAVRAASLLTGTGLQSATVPERSFMDAYVALQTEAGTAPNATVVDEVRRAADALDPDVLRATAILMSGAAESGRLQREAFARLTADEKATLLSSGPIDDAFLAADITQAEVDRLAALSSLAAKVDRDALAQAQLAAILAVGQARDALSGLETQGDARPLAPGLFGLLQRLAPWTTARAQSSGCVDLPENNVVFSDCENDVLLIVRDVGFFSFGVGATSHLVVVTGSERSRLQPEVVATFVPGCAPEEVPCNTPGTFPEMAQYGAPKVHLDLGGNDVYALPVAMTYPTETLPVSLHLDMGGSDAYQDSSALFSESTFLWFFIGSRDGHPTQGSAIGGGVAILYDNAGADRYEAPAFSQGYGQWGLGMLVDTGGSDIYTAGRWSEGAAGRDFNLGVGLLLDTGGDDRYRAPLGQGFGTGGVLVDLGGVDVYSTDHPALGAPIAHLTILPGGNLTTLTQRGDDRTWLDGPAGLNVGLGVDTSASVSSRNSDGDLFVFSDFVETVFGTDPYDRDDSPQTRPAAQAEKLATDTDGDAFPDFIERAMSTDPKDARSMPFSLPVGPTFLLPSPVGEQSPGRAGQNAAPVAAKGADKVIDLRVPVQDAGTIDFACMGPALIGNALNVTTPAFGVNPKNPDEKRGVDDGPCLFVGYSSTSPGEAVVADPNAKVNSSSAGGWTNKTLRYPVGILAIGDGVPTSYDVDYFLVIDLGGDDVFRNGAGGALAVTRRAGDHVTESFVAPSLVLNVDVAGRQSTATGNLEVRNPDGALGRDAYAIPANATGDYSQGSMWGLLLDTQGDDAYTAGSAAQGALGGVLLDLKGQDSYKAGDLAQGATLLATSENTQPLPGDGSLGADRPSESGGDDAPLRRIPPGLHLDMGADSDVRKARNASQGFSRGVSGSAGVGAGILLDQGGDDQYLTFSDHGRGQQSQGVATAGGVGVLLDLKGNDTYTAWGPVSQGATISQSYGADPASGSRYAPGAALLADTGGVDRYQYADLLGLHDRTAERQDVLTIQRGELSQSDGGTTARKSLYAEPALHYDGEDVSLNAVAGTGRRDFTSVDQTNPAATDVNDLYVDLPAARLAIGGPQASRYERDYAFVVDLGGANTYAANAGGVVPDALARSEADGDSLAGGADATLPLFPVSFVLDAGRDASLYQAARGLVQGAGFFSVGVLVDLGGDDRFVALPQPLDTLAAAWAPVEPTIDAALNEPAWSNVTPRALHLRDVNDSRFVENFSVRVTNDASNVYVAIEGHTPSPSSLAQDDVLFIDVNPGRSLMDRAGAEVDSIVVKLGKERPGDCVLLDGHYDADQGELALDAPNTLGPTMHGRAACAYRPADGNFTIEVSKPLHPGIPRDEQDLDLPYDPKTGFRMADRQAGLRIGYLPAGAGDEFAWPQDTTRRDGEGAFPADGDMSQEVAAWASFAFANLGAPGVPAPVTRTPALSQGAGLAGVGILAHLGTTSSNNAYVASDHAQGYGAFGGLGLLLDAGSSDAYQATTQAQAFADEQGLGALVDAEGDDNYRSVLFSLGATPTVEVVAGEQRAKTAHALAFFVDLGGYDDYDTHPRAADRDAAGPAQVPADVGTPTPLGPVTMWRTGGGFGLDYLSQDNARGVLRSLFAGEWFGATRTTLTLHRADDAGQCASAPSTAVVQGDVRSVATGVVCLVAHVDLHGGRFSGQAGTTFDVEAVDFLVAGRRVATVNVTEAVTPRGGEHTFKTLFDSRDVPDGVAAFRAVALVRATVDAGDGLAKSVTLFYDQATEGNNAARVDALVDNPAQTTLKLWPEFEGGADAVFSPTSALDGKNALQIDWNASHDAGEERLALKQGWKAPPELSNVPCAPNATRLCDLLPFFLRPSGAYIDTEPVEYVPSTPDATFQQSDGDNPFTQKIAPLTTPLTIYKEDAFHLHLNTHRAILDGNYNTSLRVLLTDANGNVLYRRNETGVQVPVVLAETKGNTTSRQNLGISPTTNQFLGGSRGTVDLAVNTVMGKLSQGNVLGIATSTIHDLCRPGAPIPNVGPNGVEACGNLYGYPGYAGVKPCQPPGPNAVGAQRIVFQTLYDNLKGTAACTPVLQTLNETAATGDGALSEQVKPVGERAAGATAYVFVAPDSAPLNWLDFFASAEQPALPPGSAAFAEDAETLTIPPGYGLTLVMNVTSDGTPVPATFGGLWKQVLGTVVSNIPEYPVGEQSDVTPVLSSANQKANETMATRPETNRPLCYCLADREYHDVVYNHTEEQRGEGSNVGNNVDGLVKNPIPVAYFYLGDAQSTSGTGGRQLPARLEVRVPTEPSTRATIRIEDPATGETVATLLDAAPVTGDVPGSPTLYGREYLQLVNNSTGVVQEEHAVYVPRYRAFASAWGSAQDDSRRFTEHRTNFTGALPGGALLPEGTYRLNVTTWDEVTRAPDTRASTFLIDRAAPATFVESRAAGTASMDPNGGLPVTWTVHESSSGLHRTWVLYRIGEGEWKNATTAAGDAPFEPARDAFPESTRTYIFRNIGRESVYSFVTIGQDRAGNLEFDVAPGLPLADRIYAAAMAKVGAGLGAVVTLDQTIPGVRGDGIEGARRVAFQGADFTFVKAGTPVTFRACARDSDGSDVGLVRFSLSYLASEAAAPVTRSFNAASTGACGDGSHLWTYGAWGDENADKTLYPDGVWTVAVQAYDTAGNPVNVGMGSLILDAEAPRLRLEAPVYPPGQTAVKPGDRLTLRIYAQDAFGVDDARIAIDASALTKQGTLGTRPVRIGGVILQEAALTVDRSNLQNGNVTLEVRVPDNAGNVNVTQFVVPVDFKTFVIPPETVSVGNATHNSVVVRWSTTEPTTSQVRFGLSPLEMKLRTTANLTLTTQHEVKVENLSPSTRYFLRALSSTAGGYVNESDTLDAATGSALFLEPLGPAANSALRGPVDVRFKGGLLDSSEFVAFTLEAQSEPDAPWSFVTTTTESAGNHTLTFNTTRYLDGASYRLRLTAEAGKDKLSATLGPYLSDNTPPRLVVVGPLVATNDTTPRLVAEAEDNLARFNASAATLLIDGKAVEALETDATGDVLRVAYDVAEPLTAGAHAFELRVTDKAGNPAVEAWAVAIDGEAPTMSVNPSGFAPGRAAAKLGGTVTLNVTVKDASGVQSVTADTRGLSSQATTRFSRVTGTDLYVGTFPVTDANPEATHRIVLTATDLAGNVKKANVDVLVDNVAPIVAEARASDVGQTRAVLVADANEPIVLVGTFTATQAPPVKAAGDKLSAHATLPLEGLLPSRTYAYAVQAMDRAGNSVDLTGRFQTALDLKPPTAVTGLTVLDLLNGTLRLSWSAATDDVGLAYYRVYRSDDAGASFKPIAEVRSLTFDDARLPLEKAFTYQVFAVDWGGNEGKGSEPVAASATAVPHLTAGVVTPTVGSTATVFRYVVTYVSPGGVAPAYVRVYLDGAAQEMKLQPGGTAETGLTYVYESRLAPHKRDAPHTYHYEASDGRYVVRFPEAGEPLRGPLVSGDANAASALEGAAAFAQKVPLLGAAGVVLALVAAAAIVLVLRRRGTQ